MVSWWWFSWIGFQPLARFAGEAHETLGQVMGGDTPGELLTLVLRERVGGGIDVDEAIARLDGELCAGNVAQAAGRQPRPGLLPILVFLAHLAPSLIQVDIVLDRFLVLI